MGRRCDKRGTEAITLSHGFPYFTGFLIEQSSNDFGTESTSVPPASLILQEIRPPEIEQTP